MKRYMKIPTILTAVLFAGLLAGCGADTANDTKDAASDAKKEQVVNVYTARNYEADETIYKDFTAETGIKVNLVEGKAEELIERLKREGQNTSADLFVTVDGGVLNNAKEAGVLQPVASKKVDEQVPAELRDADNQWIGIATRARVIVYSKDRVKPEQLSTYEDLASDKWKGKLLVRSSTSLYNQSLVASLLELNGEQNVEAWAKGVVGNFARNPEGGDRDQVKAIAAGVGDVAIMNTYYVGAMLNSKEPEEVKAAQGVGVFFPNQETTGAHVNISGMGLAKHSKNKENAVKLIEYMTDVKAQTMITQTNYEFPVNAKAELPELLKSWGEFKTQKIDFSKLGAHNKQALLIMNKVGWK
ncbi:iron(III) transport system substrate-binding protein [Tumebacillus sp. BK434]|uniref:Fe(3+) ABC transporter substrate-binding protein n=1 Tax=Tumebacillus sp. BK434 TaxID=2512169 RepID=UPI0010519203|nr:Fe(3+) ABC transporter substrate-binding protein [Tumebacillus sp. BK434]TCP57915.1 iron(III) transport system substrate-binding protein [Tumebacillus sp. BK434]